MYVANPIGIGAPTAAEDVDEIGKLPIADVVALTVDKRGAEVVLLHVPVTEGNVVRVRDLARVLVCAETFSKKITLIHKIR